jgi:hypothetical protein
MNQHEEHSQGRIRHLALVLNSPCTRFGNNQRAGSSNWQRMSPPMLVHQSATHRRAARTIAGHIHRPNQTTAVCKARACRRTSLCNLRAHSFAQLPQHPTGTSQLSMYKNCVTLAAHNASQ